MDNICKKVRRTFDNIRFKPIQTRPFDRCRSCYHIFDRLTNKTKRTKPHVRRQSCFRFVFLMDEQKQRKPPDRRQSCFRYYIFDRLTRTNSEPKLKQTQDENKNSRRIHHVCCCCCGHTLEDGGVKMATPRAADRP